MPAWSLLVRGSRGPAMLLVLLLSVLVALPAGPPAAARPAPDAGAAAPTRQPVDPVGAAVRVEIDRVDPGVARRGTPVVVRGTLVNRTTEPVRVDSVRLGTAYRGLDTPAAVAEWGAGGTGVQADRVVGTGAVGAVLQPGASRPFRAAVPGDAVQPPFIVATLPLLVEATGPDGEVLGSTRSYLPWVGEAHLGTPLRTAVLLPLTLPADPALAGTDPAVRAAAWDRAVGPRSPAVQALRQLGDAPVTFVVDPALLVPLQPVGSLVATPTPEGPDAPATEVPAEEVPADEAPATAGPTGSTAAPPAATTAQPPAPGPPDRDGQPGVPGGTAGRTALDPTEQLRDLLGRLPDQRLWWLPAHDPDVAGLLQARAPQELVERLLRQRVSAPADLADGSPQPRPTPAELLEQGRRDIAWPVLREVDDALFARIVAGYRAAAEDEGTPAPAAVVVPADAVTGAEDDPGPVVEHATGTPLLGYDRSLSAPLATPDAFGGSGGAVQRFLAETLARWQAQPALERSVVVALPRAADLGTDLARGLDQALRQADWLAAVPAASLLEQQRAGAEAPAGPGASVALTAPAGTPAGPTAYPVAGPSPLTAARVEQVERLRRRLHGFALVLPRGEERADTWDPVLDAQYSARWRQDPPAWQAVPDAAAAVAAQVSEGVRIIPSTVNFLADEGLIQVTVVNELPVEVAPLQVTATPGNGRLRVVEQPDPVSIGPGSRATVQFTARAVGSGTVPVRMTLTTPDGSSLGSPEDLLVRVQPTGVWIYWVLGVGAGAILVVGLVRAWRPRSTPDPHPESP